MCGLHRLAPGGRYAGEIGEAVNLGIYNANFHQNGRETESVEP